MGLVTECTLVRAAGMGDEDRDNERAGAFFGVMQRGSACHVGHTIKGMTVDGLQGRHPEQVFWERWSGIQGY